MEVTTARMPIAVALVGEGNSLTLVLQEGLLDEDVTAQLRRLLATVQPRASQTRETLSA